MQRYGSKWNTVVYVSLQQKNGQTYSKLLPIFLTVGKNHIQIKKATSCVSSFIIVNNIFAWYIISDADYSFINIDVGAYVKCNDSTIFKNLHSAKTFCQPLHLPIPNRYIFQIRLSYQIFILSIKNTGDIHTHTFKLMFAVLPLYERILIHSTRQF